MVRDVPFTDGQLAIDSGLGYPKAYAKLCRDRGVYSFGPPFTFTPYILTPTESASAWELEQMFPIIDPESKPTAKPRLFVSLLWKQLNHLGNAGFDPQVFRVDPFGNVLYYHADSASPLAWDIDHWFPCSRGGLTVLSNLRILQLQVRKRKHNELEFLVPWWELQLGISVNQFLSIFASSNSDFRHRAFSLLFAEGKNEELNDSLTVDSHVFPHHFNELKDQVGLAPAAIVVSQRASRETESILRSLDHNRQLRPSSPVITNARKVKPSLTKENENPDIVNNPYRAIVMARDSLKQREEASKMQAEIQELDAKVNEFKRKNEEEKVAIQDLETVLIKRKRRAEKCRRLAETQSSYRTMLEKMIRDAMHQNVIYKEQLRLNQAATSALMARLEAQKAICDTSEKELHRKFKQREEIETMVRPEWEQARKRSRMEDTLLEENDDPSLLLFPEIKPSIASANPLLEQQNNGSLLIQPGEQSSVAPPIHKELRVYLEEEQKAASRSSLSIINEELKDKEKKKKKKEREPSREKLEEHDEAIAVLENECLNEDKFQSLEIEETRNYKFRFPNLEEPEREEGDEESRKRRGKGNVEKWLQKLLENTQGILEHENAEEEEEEAGESDEMIRKLNAKYPRKEMKISRTPQSQQKKEAGKENKQPTAGERGSVKRKEESLGTEAATRRSSISGAGSVGKRIWNSPSFEGKERKGKKEKALGRSESARGFRSITASPSVMEGIRRGVECIRKKPIITSDEDEDAGDPAARSSFIRSSIKTIKKAVKM